MKKKFLLISLVLSLCCVLLFTINYNKLFAANNNTILAGTAKVKITPEVPIQMSGYGGRKEPFKGVHDDLFLRVIAFSDGENKGVIIAADLIGFTNTYWEETTKRLEREIGIPQDNILLCATHTHGGPTPANIYRSDPPSPEIIAYTEELTEKIVTTVREAVNNLQPALIGSGKGECKMNMNRRARSAQRGIILGKNPDGPCDHEVGVVRIDDENLNPISIFVNWPCHGTVMSGRNYQITGDWPGAAAAYVEKEFDDTIIAPVTAGTSGDINGLYGPDEQFGYVDITGIMVGEEVVRVAKDIKTFPYGSVSATQRLITLPRKQRARSNFPQKTYEPGPNLDVRLSALKVGNIVFAGISGEVMNEIGLDVKKLSPFKYTYVISHCNGSSGYLVTDEAYQEGGYEVRSTRAMLGAEKAIIVNLVDMINGL